MMRFYNNGVELPFYTGIATSLRGGRVICIEDGFCPYDLEFCGVIESPEELVDDEVFGKMYFCPSTDSWFINQHVPGDSLVNQDLPYRTYDVEVTYPGEVFKTTRRAKCSDRIVAAYLALGAENVQVRENLYA